jgi:hypothetical protein
VHVLDRWRHVATARSEAELHDLDCSAGDKPFDLESYRVLARFLKALPAGCEVFRMKPRTRDLV